MEQKKMKKALEAADVVINFFTWKPTVKSNEFFDRLIPVDDDVYAAYLAADKYHQQGIYHHYPKISPCGGFGLMSTRINPRLKNSKQRVSEAFMHAYILERLGVSEEDIDVLFNHGTNTGANVNEVAQGTKPGEKLLFCLTQRLSGRFYLTQKKQHPELNASYLVKFQSLKEVICWYNGKKLGGALPYLAEAASIYDRYLRYTKPDKNGKVFMDEWELPIPEDVHEAGRYLNSLTALKTPGFRWSKLVQFIKVYVDMLRHRKRIAEDLENKIQIWQDQLANRYMLDKVEKEDPLFGGKRVYLQRKW